MPMPTLRRNDAGMCNNPVIAVHHCRVRGSFPILRFLCSHLRVNSAHLRLAAGTNGANERARYVVSRGSGSG